MSQWGIVKVVKAEVRSGPRNSRRCRKLSLYRLEWPGSMSCFAPIKVWFRTDQPPRQPVGRVACQQPVVALPAPRLASKLRQLPLPAVGRGRLEPHSSPLLCTVIPWGAHGRMSCYSCSRSWRRWRWRGRGRGEEGLLPPGSSVASGVESWWGLCDQRTAGRMTAASARNASKRSASAGRDVVS